MTIVNWNDLWKYAMLTSHRIEIGNTAFWDDWASRENESKILMAALTENQLERIRVRGEDTLLEIGPGSGRLTIPLAKIAKRITVVEPSKNMLLLLKKNAEKENVNNINCINKRWEEIELGKDVKKHDVVLASFSLLMDDLRESLLKIDNAARREVYLFISADDWMPIEIQRLIYGDKISIGLTDHIIAYNLLDALGIKADIEIVDHLAIRQFETLEDAILDFTKIYNVPTTKIEALRDYLQKTLVEKKGKLLFYRKKKVAMIWWRKSG